jgi:hypothetical protein
MNITRTIGIVVGILVLAAPVVAQVRIVTADQVRIGPAGSIANPASIEVRSASNAVVGLNRIGSWAGSAAGLKLPTDDAQTDYWTVGMLPDSTNNFYVARTGTVYLTVDGSGNTKITNALNPVTNYSSDLGSDAVRWKTAYIADLAVWRLVAKDVVSSVGGEIWTAETTVTTAALTAAGGTLTVKDATLASGDRVVLKSLSNIEWMAVTSGAGGSAGAYTYSVTRDLDTSGANDWPSGTAVVSTGTTGDGLISQYATSSSLPSALGSAALVGPTMVGAVRTGTAWDAMAARWAVGNLEHLYDYTGATYGFAAGNPSATWVAADATNGFRVKYGSTPKMTIDASGNASFSGTVTAGNTVLDTSGIGLNADSTRLSFGNFAQVYGAVGTEALVLASTGWINFIPADGTSVFNGHVRLDSGFLLMGSAGGQIGTSDTPWTAIYGTTYYAGSTIGAGNSADCDVTNDGLIIAATNGIVTHFSCGAGPSSVKSELAALRALVLDLQARVAALDGR